MVVLRYAALPHRFVLPLKDSLKIDPYKMTFAIKRNATIITGMTIRIIIISWTILLSTGTQAAEQFNAYQLSDPIVAGQIVLKSLPNPIQNLLQYALSNEGVSYRRGRTNPESGFDCSGFVRYVFDQVEGVTLPHSASAISKIGNSIKVSELLPGDLVFFRFMRNTISHVGIYLGNNQFIHAASTRTGSVIISNLTDNYWARHFTLGRRIDISAGQTSNITDYLPASPALQLETGINNLPHN